MYDAGGQRLRKVTERQNGKRKAERIYLGGFEIYREFDASAADIAFERETLHVMDDKQRIALVETRTQGDDGSPPQLIRYQFGNHLGSASLELDDKASVISYEEYFPYGSTSYQAVDQNIKAAVKRYRYTGKERDEETGFTYHGARYYAPWLGRWVSCDPAGMVDGLNIYMYAMNHPINFSDSTGTACDSSITTCPELMKNFSYGTSVPNRSDVGHNVQKHHVVQVSLRKEERGGKYNRSTSASRSEQTVLVETGRGYFHTEVGKLQTEVENRVRAGIITTQSELIEATRNAFDLAAQATGVQVDTQALDRAIVSNLATLSESPSQTHSELTAQGATAADFDAQISSAEHAFVDPSPPPPDPASERAKASVPTTTSDGSVNKSFVATEKTLAGHEDYEASLAANLIVLAIAAYPPCANMT